MRRRRSR
ncbi:hypothetical protein LINPERHAP1_LOCUS6462 [Linum perenne]